MIGLAAAGLAAAASLLSFILVVWDKRQATRGGRRVRERTLWTLALLGGFPGGLWAMRLARHKTAKPSFMRAYGAAAALHLAVLAGGAWLLL